MAVSADEQPHLGPSHNRSAARCCSALGADSCMGLVVLAAAYAPRRPGMPGAVLSIPDPLQDRRPALWAAVAELSLDCGSLLADDQVLDAEQHGREHFLDHWWSAAACAAMPELSRGRDAWVGSRFCTEYITRQLDGAVEPNPRCAGPVSSRPRGIQPHRHRDLTAQALFARTGVPSGRAFCVLEDISPKQRTLRTHPERLRCRVTEPGRSHAAAPIKRGIGWKPPDGPRTPLVSTAFPRIQLCLRPRRRAVAAGPGL